MKKPVRLKNRKGFEKFGMRLLYRLLYPFIHCRLVYAQELPEDGDPVVYVANHYNVFGPASFVLSVPTISRFWSNEDVNTPEAAAKTIYPDIKSIVPFLGERAVLWICGKVGKLLSIVLAQFKPISVSRHDPGRLISTMRKSVSVLQEGESILIFPETGLPEYSQTSVTPFFSGFATVGMIYYRKTGKRLKFCPCYIDAHHHIIHFGELITYEPEGTVITEESARVSDELNLRIREMADRSRRLPAEKDPPARRSVMFFCNLLRLLLLIPLLISVSSGNPRLSVILYACSQGLRILFNAAVSRPFPSSNRAAFLWSHALGLLTDICVLSFLSLSGRAVTMLLFFTIGNFLVFLLSNIITKIRTQWCAGCNYFDMLSANLICFICILHLLDIPLVPFFRDALMLATYIFLGVSAVHTVIYNARSPIDPEVE